MAFIFVASVSKIVNIDGFSTKMQHDFSQTVNALLHDFSLGPTPLKCGPKGIMGKNQTRLICILSDCSYLSLRHKNTGRNSVIWALQVLLKEVTCDVHLMSFSGKVTAIDVKVLDFERKLLFSALLTSDIFQVHGHVHEGY